LCARKLIVTVFWDGKGVLMAEFMQQETTITSEVYYETLKKLRGAIQKKRRGMLTYSVVLLLNNAGPHTVARTQTLLEHFNWQLLDHHPYSPDLAPSEYHLFTYLKILLVSKRFSNNEELMKDVKTWLISQAAEFFDTGIQKLIPRYDKCLNSGS
jgi:transposase